MSCCLKNVSALKQKMREVGGLKNITDNWGQRIKKLEIRVKSGTGTQSRRFQPGYCHFPTSRFKRPGAYRVSGRGRYHPRAATF